jgi:hypothetical protein
MPHDFFLFVCFYFEVNLLLEMAMGPDPRFSTVNSSIRASLIARKPEEIGEARFPFLFNLSHVRLYQTHGD